MKYMGSKARIAKDILPIILKNRKPNQWYVEPFAGGMNSICEVEGNRLANDNNLYLIEMWKYLMDTEEVPFREINRDYYNMVRSQYNGSEYLTTHPGIVGWVGYMASANGRFFEGGYSGVSVTKDGGRRDYIEESIRNIEKQIPKMRGVNFSCLDYRDLIVPPESVLYCDIPYRNTKQYATSKNFNHAAFYDWCYLMFMLGHTVFISEYWMPDEFTCVWEKEVKSSLSANGVIGGSKTSTEKLFTIL